VPHPRGADEWLEPDEGRLSCPILRGRRRRKALLLPDQLHGVDVQGKIVLRKALKRSEVVKFFVELPPCLIGMEACGSAHFWARRLMELGHTVKLMAPQFVKPYVKAKRTTRATPKRFAKRLAGPACVLCRSRALSSNQYSPYTERARPSSWHAPRKRLKSADCWRSMGPS
jgi:transposase